VDRSPADTVIQAVVGERMLIASQGNEGVRVPWAHLRIPPFPLIAIRVLQLASQEDVPMRQLSDLISSDPAFSSEVLTIANSALYPVRVPIHSVLQAIAILGTNSIKGLSLTVGVRAYMGNALHHESLRAIWRHSLACALIANQVAAAGTTDKDSAYTAGILHDIGRLALAVLSPKEYATLLETHVGPPASALEAERALFGFDHCEAGLRLIAEWKMPPYLSGVVSDHHSPRVHHDTWQIPDIIHLSCRMADAIGFAAFQGCELTAYADLVAALPARERRGFPDSEVLAFDVSSKINAVESS
jgi:putative nucleotidyltransferase with HDIG domain